MNPRPVLGNASTVHFSFAESPAVIATELEKKTCRGADLSRNRVADVHALAFPPMGKEALISRNKVCTAGTTVQVDFPHVICGIRAFLSSSVFAGLQIPFHL